jgi:triacylglycerol esterase/lipase EstA (alpha/beta hydrolase family)
LTDAKVSLIGHSLGGIYARELSEKFPGLVERAILLGSPLKDPVGSTSVNLKLLAEFFYRRCQSRGGPANGRVSLSPNPPEVPETLIYSKADAVVQWQSCIELGPQVEAIEVHSSHCGLPYSPEAFETVAARLGQCTERRLTNKSP